MSDQEQPDLGGVAPDKQIVKASGDWLHPLQPYGPKKALREMTRRIMEMDTGKIPMIAREAAHLAQQAASAWLNPFTGEIWGWVQIMGDGSRKFTIMPGRRGLLRHAHEQAREMGTHFWPEYRQITDPDERANLFIPTNALSYECQLKDHKSQMTWNETLDKVTAAVLAGIDIDTSIIKSPPFVFGIGILTKQEMDQLNKGKNKMSHVERCQKRAYMMALKQMFDLPLGGAVGTAGETIEDYVIDVEWREVPQIPKEIQCFNEECGEGVPLGEDVCPECGTEGQLEHLKEKAKEGAETLFEDGSKKDGSPPEEIKEKPKRDSAGFWPNEVLNEIVARMLAQNVHSSAKILAKSEFEGNVAKEPACAYVKAYRSQKDQDKSSAQCHKYALENWQELMKEKEDE